MAKRKEQVETPELIDINIDEIKFSADNKTDICKSLYKYEIGDEVFVMEDNKVKSFTIGKRIILTRLSNDDKIETVVYYDESNWNSLKAEYSEQMLYPSKKKLLESL